MAVRQHLKYIEKSIESLDDTINKMIQKHDSLIALLCTIPGMDRSSAVTVISEIGTDMSQFGCSKRLCCRAGLTPGNNESAALG